MPCWSGCIYAHQDVIEEPANNAHAVVQNALKIFKNMPKSLMDIVKKTDPTTVTQHGLYMRPLTDPALHPLVAKAPPATSPDTSPREEEQTTRSPAASDPPETVATATLKELVKHSENTEQPAATDAAGSSPQNATADKQADNAAAAAAAHVQSTAELTGASAGMEGPSLPTRTPAATKGKPTGPVGRSSTSIGASAPVQACSTTKGSSSLTPPDSSEAFPGKGAETPGDGYVGWGRGRVTLLGDAAHATIPNGMWLLFLVRRLQMVSCVAAYHCPPVSAACNM